MKFKHSYAFATAEAAEQKLLDLANAIEADHAGRVPVGSSEMRAAPLRNTARRWLPLSPMVG
jgi:DNA-binding transcriptional regulator/RsmH inhibitor MraZ